MGNRNIVRSSQVLELQHLIAGPLIATIEADALSAQKYLHYVLSMAFESYNSQTGKTGKLRMLTFSYNEQDGENTLRRTVNVPLLTLVPLPLLQIHEADFDFDIKILDALYEKADEKFLMDKKSAPQQNSDRGEFKMRASLAPQQPESGRSGNHRQGLAANMKVKVRMQRADMPAGLSNILHLTANNVIVNDEQPATDEEGGDA